MKRQIRFGVFETNSSSTHSLTMCSIEDFKAWENGDLLLNDNWKLEGQFITINDAENYLKEEGYLEEDIDEYLMRKYEFYTAESYFDDEYLESFSETYTTPGGEEVVAFGLYGHNG